MSDELIVEIEPSVELEVEFETVPVIIDGYLGEQVTKIIVLDRYEYEALTNRPSTTLYLIKG